jgi:IMP cyclohydrolase
MPSQISPEARANFELLARHDYPGRGLFQGINDSGRLAVQGFFITGRSEPSQTRVAVEETSTLTHMNQIRIRESADADANADMSNRRYVAMATVDGYLGNSYIVSNGVQTDTIADAIAESTGFAAALQLQDYEDDNEHTPRISGLIDLTAGVKYPQGLLSLVTRKSDAELTPEELARRQATPESAENGNIFSERLLFPQNLDPLTAGTGLLLHTYSDDYTDDAPRSNPVPSFEGSPRLIPIGETLDEIAQTYWGILPPEKRVSIIVRGISFATGEDMYEIINTRPE